MEIIPAIDIRGGRCVRLIQGDYAQETVFGDDPLAMAERWQAEGATRLHVVDLDGARAGAPANRTLIERIAARVHVPVEVGGGIRSETDAVRYHEAGLDRVILGTAALEDRTLVEQLLDRLGAALAVGIDARDGIVMTRGWVQSGAVQALALAADLAAAGVRRFIYTDIVRDGMLQGPNLTALQAFIAAAGVPVVASGGITTVADLAALTTTAAEAAIVGKALYTGVLTLAAAHAAAGGVAGRSHA